VKSVKEIVKKDPPKDPPKKEEKKEVKKDEKKDAKDPKDKKDPPKEAPKEMKDPKDAGEMKRLGPTTDDPYSLVWSPATKTLAVCGYSGQVTTWALDNEKPKFTKPIKSPGYCITFTKDGKAVLTGHDNGTVAFTPLDGK